MEKINDTAFLRGEQYKDDTNLKKRMGLHERFSTNPTGWHHWMTDQFDFPAVCQILEVGCGPGTLWSARGESLPTSWQVTLSDFSSGMVAKAKRALAEQHKAPSYRFAVSDAQSLPFHTASFDVLIANHMLYHVPDRSLALAEFRRVLRPGGRLFAATNGKNTMHELHEWIVLAANLTQPDLVSELRAVTLSFNLENGREQLEQQFSSVELVQYPDSLEVTQAEPLIQYVQSMMSYNQTIIQNLVGKLRELWEAEIQTHGAVHISKDGGLFQARSDD